MKLFFAIFNSLNLNEKKKFIWIVFFISVLLILELASLSVLLPIIKIIFTAEKLSYFNYDFFNEYTLNQQIYFLLAILVFFFFLKNILNAFLIYLKKRFLYDIQINFSSRVFSNYLNQSYEFFLKNNKPQIMRNLGILAEYIIVLENFINIAIEGLILILILSIIYYSNFYVGLTITIFSIIFVYLILKIFKDRFKKYGELINFYNEKVLNNYLDSLGSIKDIILQKKQNFFVNDFSKNISVQANINVKNSFFVEVPRLLIEVVLVGGIAGLIVVLSLVNQNFNEIIVILTFTIALILRAIPSVTRIIYQSSGLYFKVDTIKRVQSLISSFKERKNIKKSINNIDFKKIYLKKVSFSYDMNSSQKIFNNLDLDITKNNTIGIIGSSGSGKSTLLDLICGILKPSQGNIFLDDDLLDEEKIFSWQNKISYISQKNYLLNGSILENIAFAENPNDININRVKEAIKFSKLQKLVKDKSNGLDFNIGEDGKNISGGQRQRIILARAIYRKADLIIFDEATSALDKSTENEILGDIKDNFHKKKTLIISTHKSDTLYFCDKVLNIDDFKG